MIHSMVRGVLNEAFSTSLGITLGIVATTVQNAADS